MGRETIVTAVDLGSSLIRVAAGFFRGPELKKLILVTRPARGMARGAVTGLGEASESLYGAIEEARQTLGRPIVRCWLGLSGGRVHSVRGTGSVAVSGADHEICPLDIQRSLIAAEVAVLAERREALHVVPIAFTVDAQTGIADPLGMFGHELGVEALIIAADMAHTQNVLRLVRRAGLHIDGILYAPLAAGACLTTDQERHLGAVLIDIGRDTTDVVFFAGGQPEAVFTVPIGGGHFDRDISYGFRISLADAESLKCSYPSVGALSANSEAGEFLTHIMRTRAEELFEMIGEALPTVNLRHVLLSGGMGNMGLIIETAQNVLQAPCCPAVPNIGGRTGQPGDATLSGIWNYAISRIPQPYGETGVLPALRAIAAGICRKRALKSRRD